MESSHIEKEVNYAVEQWISLQAENGISFSITPRAIYFISELIANIQLDPSENWQKLENYNSAQEQAISLIPKALNDIAQFWRLRYRNHSNPVKISSWELWGALSTVFTRFCFIPEKDLQ